MHLLNARPGSKSQIFPQNNLKVLITKRFGSGNFNVHDVSNVDKLEIGR
uniref:Uncharacterized protein n=1 Tax=Nelumbo nucifera TaxID=4432 RepID=A0A822ZSH5_NELNU|nr:TPA_asm: hypothetical protein HUJ06_016448 [Nelumbo nucifera]